jgi:hypothetical protein
MLEGEKELIYTSQDFLHLQEKLESQQKPKPKRPISGFLYFSKTVLISVKLTVFLDKKRSKILNESKVNFKTFCKRNPKEMEKFI